MNPYRLLALAAALLLPMTAPAATTAADPPTPLSWAQLQKLPLPSPVPRIAYGTAPQQFGELRLPSGKAPATGWPVIVLIHGGCWQNAFDYVYITRLAAWLATQGFASWTIEYARLGDTAGGWPGTFADVAAATDALRRLAKTAPLDLHAVYAAGHSAGGQLALWLASRGKLAAGSAVYANDPLPIRGVLGLAAITDLDSYRIGPPDSCHSAVEPLLGGTPEQVPQRYAETSPLRRLPLGVPAVFVQGDHDPIVEISGVRAYVEAATRAGDTATLLTLPGAGHFDTAVPIAVSESVLKDALKRLRAAP